MERSWKCTVGTPNSSGANLRATIVFTMNGSSLDTTCVTVREKRKDNEEKGAWYCVNTFSGSWCADSPQKRQGSR